MSSFFERMVSGDPEQSVFASEFLGASPEDRYSYLTNNQFTQKIGQTPRAAAAALRGITQGRYSNDALTSDQLQLALSGMDPDFAQQVASQFGGLVTAQKQHKSNFVNEFMEPIIDFANDFVESDYFIPLLAAAGGAGLGAFGGGTAGATGAESFVGPATGTIESAPIIGGAGAPSLVTGGSSLMNGGLGNLLKLVSGESGGVPEIDEILKKLGIKTGPGIVGTGMNIFSGLYGLNQSREMQKLAERASQQQDPFAGERGQYAGMLRDLMANPGAIINAPGYKAGEQAIMRKMASQGYLGSGNMMTALHDFGGRTFDAEAQRLASLAGANFSPSGGGMLLRGAEGANDLASKSLATLGYSSRDIEELLKRVMH